MVTAGLLICGLAALTILLLIRLPQGASLETVFVRLSWLPLAALVAQVFLWPFLRRLSYAALLPPLLTCLASLFLGVMGATLIATRRERNEPDRRLRRATLVAASPGLLLLAYMVYGWFG